MGQEIIKLKQALAVLTSVLHNLFEIGESAPRSIGLGTIIGGLSAAKREIEAQIQILESIVAVRDNRD